MTRPLVSHALRLLLAAALALGVALPATSASPSKAYAEEVTAETVPSVEAYIEDNADESLVGKVADETATFSFFSGDRSSLTDTGHYAYVKYLVCNADEMQPTDTIDDVWFNYDVPPVLAQYGNTVPVYEISPDADYYVAFVDNNKLNEIGTVQDYSFTEGNNNGIELEGVIYDQDAGIIYIPRDFYFNENGEEIWYAVQQQLLVSYSLSAGSDVTVPVAIENNHSKVTSPSPAFDLTTDALDITVSVPVATPDTAAYLDLSNFTVYLNGETESTEIALNDEVAAYNSATGELELSLNPFVISSLKIVISGDGPLGLFATEKAHAASAADLKTLPYWTYTGLDLNSLNVGDTYEYYGNYSIKGLTYDSSDSFYYIEKKIFANTKPYGYTWSANSGQSYYGLNSTTGLSDWTLGGTVMSGNDFSAGEVIDQAYSNGTMDGLADASIQFTFTIPGINETSPTNGSSEQDWSVRVDQDVADNVQPGQWDHGRNAVAGYCAHNTEDVGNSIGVKGMGEGTMHTRVVAKGDDYVVLSILSCVQQNGYGKLGQAAIGIYKFKVESRGSLTLQKASADTSVTDGNSNYSLEGAQYGVYRSEADANADSSRVGTLTVDASGYAKMESLTAGTYYVKELVAPEGYELDATVYSATVVAGSDVCVNASDEPMTGSIALTKDSTAPDITDGNSCYSLEDAVYGVYSDEGCTVEVGRIVTDGNGEGSLDGLPINTYYVKEIEAPEGFALDDVTVVEATVAGNKTTHVEFEDIPRLDPVDIAIGKVDFETNKEFAQGSGELAGAQFHVRYYDAYLDTVEEALALEAVYEWIIYTDEDGTARLSDDQKLDNGMGELGIPLGTLLFEETAAPEGYLLPDNPYRLAQITSTGSGSTDTVYTDVEVGGQPYQREQVKRGDIGLIKFGESTMDEDAQPEVKTPLEGVKFEIVNANDANVARPDGTDAKPGEVVVTITTDAEGWATTADHKAEGANGALPYGQYLVREVASTTPEGFKTVDPFTVAISEDSVTRHFTLEDKTGTAIQIVKQDAETGEEIPAFMTFKILDANKDAVSFTTHYPETVVHTEFTTTADGRCVLPEKLMAGTYYVQEIAAPNGYVLNGELIPFTIDGSTVNQWDDPLQIVVEDVAQKGVIEIEKIDGLTGEALAGAKFEVYADEDIVTGDGTVRVKKDALVATLTTDDEGKAATGELYLGKYRVIEVEQPAGYVLDPTPVSVELAYAGQDVSATSVQVTKNNQPTQVDVFKFEAGMGEPLAGVTFGYWNVEDETIVEVKDGSGKIALTLGDTQGITIEELLAVDLDGKEFELDWNDLGYFETDDLDFGVYDLVASYAVDGVSDKEAYDAILALGIELSENSPVARYDASATVTVETVEGEDGSEEEQTGKEEDGVGVADGDAVVGAGVKAAGGEAEAVASVETVVTWNVAPLSAFVDVDKVTEFTTGEDGSFAVRYLVPGTYGFGEIETLPGYVLDMNARYITVGEDGLVDEEKTGLIAFENDYTKVEISKQDMTTSEEVPGATLKVFDSEGNIIEEWVSTTEPHMIEKLPAGDYVLREEFAPQGYLIANDVEFTVYATGVIQQVVMYDDYTKVDVVKTASDTDKALKGAKLAVVDADGNFVDIRALLEDDSVKVVSVSFDENGKVTGTKEAKVKETSLTETVEDEEEPQVLAEAYAWVTEKDPVRLNRLAPGEYSLIEVEAPDGYTIADPVKFTVDETGEVQEVEMIDDPAEKSAYDKTGRALQSALLCGMLASFACGAVVLFWMRQRRLV